MKFQNDLHAHGPAHKNRLLHLFYTKKFSQIQRGVFHPQVFAGLGNIGAVHASVIPTEEATPGWKILKDVGVGDVGAAEAIGQDNRRSLSFPHLIRDFRAIEGNKGTVFEIGNHDSDSTQGGQEEQKICVLQLGKEKGPAEKAEPICDLFRQPSATFFN